MLSMSRSLCCALLAGLAACAPISGPEPDGLEDHLALVPLPPGMPADTVLMIDNEPITRSEIDAWIETYRLVEPTRSKHALRRLIVANQFLPRAVARIIAPEFRAHAKAKIEASHAHLQAGGEPNEATKTKRIHDDWKSELGMDGWGLARTTPKGEFSEIIEGPGYFKVVKRVASPEPAEWHGRTEATIEVLIDYYIEPEDMKDLVSEGMRHVDIQIVDPEWSKYLPAYYLYLDPVSE